MNKFLLSLFMIGCMFGLTGCWDRVEVKNLALVMATGIDREPDGRIRITVQTVIPSGVGGGSDMGAEGGPGESFVLATATGKNIKDANQHLQEQLPRRLYSSHRRIILIGETQAKSGIQDVLDQFGRDPMNRMRDLIVVAKGGTAKDFLNIPTVIEKVPGEEIKTIEQQEAGSIITLLDFLRTASSEGTAPIASAIQLQSVGSGTQPFSLTHTAVFKNLKLIGYLNNQQTRGLMWVQGKITRGYITVDIPEHGQVTLLLTSTRGHIDPVIQHGKLRFDVQVEGKGEIVENDTNLDVSKKQSLYLIQKAFNHEVQRYIENAFQRAQEYDADIFGFGHQVYRKYPRKWSGMRKNWNELFKDAKLSLAVNIKPLRSGMSGPALQLKQDEVKKST